MDQIKIGKFIAGEKDFPTVKDITPQPTLTICLKIIWMRNTN